MKMADKFEIGNCKDCNSFVSPVIIGHERLGVSGGTACNNKKMLSLFAQGIDLSQFQPPPDFGCIYWVWNGKQPDTKQTQIEE